MRKVRFQQQWLIQKQEQVATALAATGQGNAAKVSKGRGDEVMNNSPRQLAQRQKQIPLLSSTSSSNSPIQKAGHAGVMIFGNQKLVKRVEQNEALQYGKIMYEQRSDDPERWANVHGVFPTIHNVIYSSGAVPAFADYGNSSSVQTWKAKHQPGDWYVEMESIGGGDVDVLDFKIGTATAQQDELMANYGKSPQEAAAKVAKMAGSDDTTETRRFGLRDSDVVGKFGIDMMRRAAGSFCPTLGEIDSKVKKDNAEGKGYAGNAQVFQDLQKIENYLTEADTVYIASSLIMRRETDRTRRQHDRIVLVDLAHPIHRSKLGFEEAKEGMLLGLNNLRKTLNGQARIQNVTRAERETL